MSKTQSIPLPPALPVKSLAPPWESPFVAQRCSSLFAQLARCWADRCSPMTARNRLPHGTVNEHRFASSFLGGQASPSRPLFRDVSWVEDRESYFFNIFPRVENSDDWRYSDLFL